MPEQVRRVWWRCLMSHRVGCWGPSMLKRRGAVRSPPLVAEGTSRRRAGDCTRSSVCMPPAERLAANVLRHRCICSPATTPAQGCLLCTFTVDERPHAAHDIFVTTRMGMYCERRYQKHENIAAHKGVSNRKKSASVSSSRFSAVQSVARLPKRRDSRQGF